MLKSDLTQEIASDILAYDPETGVFLWRDRPAKYIAGKYPSDRVRSLLVTRDVGKEAGSLNKKGYRTISVFRSKYLASHLAWLIMTGEWPSSQVDHWNLKKGDNRWDNLRLATSRENARNRRVRSDSTTGLKGVKPHEGRFHARISTDKKRISLGLFDCPVAAHLAYVVAADIHHGQFARTA